MEPGIVRKYLGGIYHAGALKSSLSGRVALLQEQAVLVLDGNGTDELEGRVTLSRLMDGWLAGLKYDGRAVNRARIFRPQLGPHADPGLKPFGSRQDVLWEENRTCCLSGLQWSHSSLYSVGTPSQTTSQTSGRNTADSHTSRRKKDHHNSSAPASFAQHSLMTNQRECLAISAYFSTQATHSLSSEEAGRESMVIIIPWWRREHLFGIGGSGDAAAFSSMVGASGESGGNEEGESKKGKGATSATSLPSGTPSTMDPSFIYISPSKTFGQEVRKMVWLGEYDVGLNTSSPRPVFSQILAIALDSEIQLWRIHYTHHSPSDDSIETSNHAQFLLSISPSTGHLVTTIQRLESEGLLEGIDRSRSASFSLAVGGEAGSISIWRISIPLVTESSMHQEATQIDVQELWSSVIPELRQFSVTEITELLPSSLAPLLPSDFENGPSAHAFPKLLIASNGILSLVDPKIAVSPATSSTSSRSSHNYTHSSRSIDEDGSSSLNAHKSVVLTSVSAHSMMITAMCILPPFTLPKSLWDARHRAHLSKILKLDADTRDLDASAAKKGKPNAKLSQISSGASQPSSSMDQTTSQLALESIGPEFQVFTCLTSSMDGMARLWLFSSSPIDTAEEGAQPINRNPQRSGKSTTGVEERSWQVELKWEGAFSTMLEETTDIHKGEGIYGTSLVASTSSGEASQTPVKGAMASALVESSQYNSRSTIVEKESRFLVKCVSPPSVAAIGQMTSQLGAKEASSVCSLLGLLLSPNALYCYALASNAPRTTPTPFSALAIIRIPLTSLIAACRHSLLHNLPSETTDDAQTTPHWNPQHWDLLLATKTLPQPLLVRLIETIQSDPFIADLCQVGGCDGGSNAGKILQSRSDSLAQVILAHWIRQNYPNWVPKSSSSSATSSSSESSVTELSHLLASLRGKCLLNHMKDSLKRLSAIHKSQFDGASSTLGKRAGMCEDVKGIRPNNLSRIDCYVLAHFATLIHSASQGDLEKKKSQSSKSPAQPKNTEPETLLNLADDIKNILNDALAHLGEGGRGTAKKKLTTQTFKDIKDLVGAKEKLEDGLDSLIGNPLGVENASFLCPYCQEPSSITSTITSINDFLEACYNPNSTSLAIPRQACPHDELPLHSCLSTGLMLSSPSTSSQCPHCSVLVFNPAFSVSLPSWTHPKVLEEGAEHSIVFCPLCQLSIL